MKAVYNYHQLSFFFFKSQSKFSTVIKRWARTVKRGQDPVQLSDMPVYQYASEKKLKLENRLYIWGFAASGALGKAIYVKPSSNFRPKETILSPRRFSFFFDANVLDISCGTGFTVVAVHSSNTCHKLFGTGINTDFQIGYHSPRRGHPLKMLVQPVPIHLPLSSSDKIIQVACGRAHTVCLANNNYVISLGNNAYGQCGREIIENEKNFVVNKIFVTYDKIKKIVCGQDHTLFLTENGEVYSCGWGADGQTGLGHNKNVSLPQKVKGDIENEKIVDLSSSADGVLACNEKGDVFGWGNSEYAQFQLVTDDNTLNIPKHLPLSHVGKVVSVASGGSMCGVVNDKGQVFVWGYGILGQGPEVEYLKMPSLLPEPLFGCNEFNSDVKVKSLHASLNHWAALTNKGDLFMWGKNKGGCLGLGYRGDQYFPYKVNVPAFVKKVSLGVDHTAIMSKALI